MLLGSLALGGGVGAIGNLVRQRNALLEDAQDEQDDDLAVPVLKKQADVVSQVVSAPGRLANWVADVDASKVQPPNADTLGLSDYMLGGAAVPIGFLGGLQLTRALYNKWRRQDLRSQLAEEQERMQQLLAEEAGKKQASGRPLSTADMVSMAMLGFIPLTAITSGLLTNAYLEQAMPTVSTAPSRRLRLKTVTVNPVTKDGGEGDDKEAQTPATGPAPVKFASAMLIHSVADRPVDSGLHGLLGAALVGALPDVEGALLKSSSAHPEAVLEFSDMYADHWRNAPEDWSKVAAVTALAGSALEPIAGMLASLEFRDAFPGAMQRAAQSGCTIKRAKAFNDAAWRAFSWAHLSSIPGGIKQAAALANQDAGSDYSREGEDKGQEWQDAIDQLMSGPQLFRGLKPPRPHFEQRTTA